MSDLHILTITYGPRATQDSLFFKSKDAAKDEVSAFLANSDPMSFITDDFGNGISIAQGLVHSIRISSLEKSLEAQTEQYVASMRAQARGQQKLQADPAMRMMGAGQQMGPMMGGMGRG